MGEAEESMNPFTDADSVQVLYALGYIFFFFSVAEKQISNSEPGGGRAAFRKTWYFFLNRQANFSPTEISAS